MKVEEGQHMSSTIKRGVSLYSYQEEYYIGKMTLEDCIAAAANGAGASGIEVIAEQMFPGNYPEPSDGFVEQWFGWMDKYHTTPTCMDAFLDYTMFPNRLLSDKEQVDLVVRDLKLAARLGFRCIRSLCITPMHIIEAALPWAEKLNVVIGLEIHAPYSIDSKWAQDLVALIQRTGTKHAAFIPDFGIFGTRPPTVNVERAIYFGATPAVCDYIIGAVQSKTPLDAMEAKARAMGANAQDLGLLRSAGMIRYNQPEWLIPILPYITHIHAKFYEMTEDCVEPSIDYENPVHILKEHGYTGYLSSEYEGQRAYHEIPGKMADSVEQVRRQHVMFRRLLGE
jgi:hypothetical protein